LFPFCTRIQTPHQFSKLPYLALNGETEYSLLHFFAFLGGHGLAGFEGYQRLADNELLRAGLFHRDKSGSLPLHLAVMVPGKADAALALARKFLELEPRAALAKNGDGNTPLHLAVIAQWVDMAKLVLEFVGGELNLDIENAASETVLQLATAKGQSALIELFLEAGCDPYYASGAGGESSLFIALHREIAIKSTGFESVLRKTLLARKTDLTRYPLHAVVCSSDGALQLLQDCLSAGMRPDTHRPEAKAPLHLVRDGNMAKLLLDAGANFRLRDNRGNTPLHYACARDCEGVTIELCSRRAKYGHEAENHENRTPKDCAVGASREYIDKLIRLKNVQRAERLKAQTQADSSMKDVESKSVAQLVGAMEDMVAAMPIRECEVSAAPADRRRSTTKAQSRSSPLLSELQFDGQPREVSGLQAPKLIQIETRTYYRLVAFCALVS
jgi:ankyrin repeat protein